jgi:uncharacterized membrane protein YhaH (DUF805 family)
MAIDLKQEINDFDVQRWLSFSGRIGRQTWWLHYVLLMVVAAILLHIVLAIFGLVLPTLLYLPLSFLANLVLLWPALAGMVKRLHDHNLEDKWAIGYVCLLFGYQLLTLIALMLALAGAPLVALGVILMLVGLLTFVAGIAMLVFCGFLKGTPGPNRFGPDPLGGNPIIGNSDQATVITPRR